MIDWVSLLKIVIAYALALPVGWERERHERSAGLRTFPLVAVASCAYILVGVRYFGTHYDAESRVIQGLIGGIGFIGAGTILRVQHEVVGTATAASLLATGIIGMAVAFGIYDIAVLLSALSLFTLRLFDSWKHTHPAPNDHDVKSSR